MTIVGEVAVGTWLAAAIAYAFRDRGKKYGDILMMLGIFAGIILLTTLWITLDRPPLRTLGETRWWYAVLVPTLGFLIGWRFETRALAIPSCLMGAMFALINIQNPDYMDKTLMPALQSPWFVPHVVVYMLAYSALGLSSLIGAWIWISRVVKRQPLQAGDIDLPHRLVMVGFPLLTCGLLFGAFWAKEAWGHYWTWDPKETWAFLTWMAYLAYLHVMTRHALKPALKISLLVIGFAVLMACWFGVNYLPTSQESVHTYTQS